MNYAWEMARGFSNDLHKVYGYGAVVAWIDGKPLASIALNTGKPTAETNIGLSGMYAAALGATDVVAAFGIMASLPETADILDTLEAPRFMVYVWATPDTVRLFRHPVHILDDQTVHADLHGWDERPVNGPVCDLLAVAWEQHLDADTLAVALRERGASVEMKNP